MNQVYRIPRLFWGPALLVLILAVPLELFFLVAGLGRDTGIALGPAMLFVGLSAPLLLGMPLYLLYHNSGAVVLTDDTVVMRRWGREKRLRYDDVVAVREMDWNLPPNLVLKGAESSVRIHTQVERYAEIYHLLTQKVEVLRLRTQAGFPFRLEATARGQILLAVGTVLVLAMYLGFGLLPIWSELSSESPDFTPVLLRNTAIWFCMLSFFFVPALYAVIVGSIAGSLRGVQPVAYLFTEETVHYRLPLGPWRSLPVDRLASIDLKQVDARVRTRGGGVVVAETVTYHEIAMRFADGQILEISLDRCRQFGFGSHELYARLTRLYPHVPSAELTAEQIAQRPVAVGTVQGARFPLTLRMTPLAFWNSLAATLFFTLCTVGTVLILLWLIVSDDPGASANGIFWLNMFLFGGFLLALTVMVFTVAFHPRQPYKLVLTAETVRFRYPLTFWRIWSVDALQSIDLRTKKVRGVRSGRGGRYTPKTIHKQAIEMRFSEGRVLAIEEDRARQFGLTAPALYALLRSLYGKQ